MEDKRKIFKIAMAVIIVGLIAVGAYFGLRRYYSVTVKTDTEITSTLQAYGIANEYAIGMYEDSELYLYGVIFDDQEAILKKKPSQYVFLFQGSYFMGYIRVQALFITFDVDKGEVVVEHCIDCGDSFGNDPLQYDIVEIDIDTILDAAEKEMKSGTISEIAEKDPDTMLGISCVPIEWDTERAEELKNVWDVRIANDEIDEIIEDIRIGTEEE